MTQKEKHQENFVNQIKHYFNLELRDYDRKRIKFYLEEYRQKDPVIQVKVEQSVKYIKAPSQITKVRIANEHIPSKKIMTDLAKKICKEFGVTFKDLTGRSRERNIAIARGQFIVDAYTQYGITQQDIADFIKRERTIVVYWVQYAKGMNKYHDRYVETKTNNDDNNYSMRNSGGGSGLLQSEERGMDERHPIQSVA